MTKYSLTKQVLGTEWLSDGVVTAQDGTLLKAFQVEPLTSGNLEDGFNGPISDNFFAKLSELLTRLPSHFDGHAILQRRQLSNSEIGGFKTTLYFFEKVEKAESYSHINALLTELKMAPKPLAQDSFAFLLSGVFGSPVLAGRLPDLTWEKDSIRVKDQVIRALSLTELPQVTWKGCFQAIFEAPSEFTLSLRFFIPERTRIKRQLETKRRVSHALSITTSLEVKNIESNSVLHSSEETLERILINKETLFEISLGVLLLGTNADTIRLSHDLERVVAGIGNAGIYIEELGSLPVLRSHIPGNRVLGIRKMPILTENLAHIFPLFHDYSRAQNASHLELRSRSGEVSHLNLFSRENLNFNAFICGASGSGKSFLMNAILTSTLKDDKRSRLCIFDVGGSYKRIVESNGGQSLSLSSAQARALIASFVRIFPTDANGFFRTFIETLCGSGSHITHSHAVAIDDLIHELIGEHLKIRRLIELAEKRPERFYHDIAHWLKPHVTFDDVEARPDLVETIKGQVSAFDFKELDSDPVLQKTTILLLTELLWRDLSAGRYSHTLIVFDEVWRFFSQSKSFLEEMYRTLRKYKAGIVSITQSLADYGDEAFAKMLFTNSYTKIFLQNGAAAEYLRETFDLPNSDIARALSVSSKKPDYSEFFVLTPTMSQIFRLYPTEEFYKLANTENIAQNPS